jgi:hypothetical protein
MELILMRRALSSRNLRQMTKGLVRFCIGRAQIMMLFAVDLYRRLAFGIRVFSLRGSPKPAEGSDPFTAGAGSLK